MQSVQIQQNDPLLLDLLRSSTFSGWSIWELRGFIARKLLPVVKINRKIFIRKATLIRFIENQEHAHRAVSRG